MMFNDRMDAGRQLAAALGRYRGARPLVLAIPRGDVPMGRAIATALEGQLDVVLVPVAQQQLHLQHRQHH